MSKKSICIWLVLCIVGVINSACGGATPTSTQAKIVPTATPTPLPVSSSVITTGNAAQIKELAQLGEGAVRHVAWSTDGSQFTAVSDKGANTFDSSSHKVVRSVRSSIPFVNNAFENVSYFSPDGNLLANANSDRILVLDLQKALAEQGELKTKYEFKVHLISFVFSPDSKLLAGLTADNRILCWDLTNGQLRSETSIGRPDLYLIAVTSDGSMFIVLGRATVGSRPIYLIDSKDGSEISILKSSAAIRGIPTMSSNGKLLAVGSEKGVTDIWDLTTYKVLKTLSIGNLINLYELAVFSPDNQRLAIGDSLNLIYIWDVQSGKLVNASSDFVSNLQAEMGTGHTDTVCSMAFSPDSQTLLSASFDGEIKLWNAADKAEIASINDLRSQNSTINISSDGSLFATGFSGTNIIQIWDTKGGRLLSTFEAKSDLMPGFAFKGIQFRILPDNKTLISISLGGIIEWEIPSGKTLHTFKDEKYSLESPIETSPDGKRLYFYQADKSKISSVFVWDITNQQVMQTLSTASPYSVNDIAVSADGSLLAAAVDSKVMIWNTANWKVVKTLSGFKIIVNVVLFSPDGSRLFTCQPDACQLWSTSTWKKTATYTPARGYGALRASGFILSISPNGQVLAISNGGNYIQLLQATDLTVLKDFNVADNVISLAFTPDGKSLLTSSEYGSIRYWGIP